jgi:hypothetical protein
VAPTLGQPFGSRDEQRSNFDAISDASLRPLLRPRFGIAGIKTINPLLPHLHENTGRKIFNGLPNVLDFRKCIFPDRLLTPLFTLLLALVSSAHRKLRKSMLQNSGSVTTRINPPLSSAEREQRYRQALRELRDPRALRELRDPRPTLQIGITEDMVRGLLKRGYLGPDECDDLNALRQAVTLYLGYDSENT